MPKCGRLISKSQIFCVQVRMSLSMALWFTYVCTSDFSMSCSVQQTLLSPFAVTWKLTIKLGVVWPAISYFVPLIACIGGTELSW